MSLTIREWLVPTFALCAGDTHRHTSGTADLMPDLMRRLWRKVLKMSEHSTFVENAVEVVVNDFVLSYRHSFEDASHQADGRGQAVFRIFGRSGA
ncbi:MAG TPA: hypothetical protein VGM18_09215 [Candidatus Sulfotelmatobacter sp.]